MLPSVRNLSQSVHFPALDYAEALTRTQSGYVALQVSAMTNVSKVELQSRATIKGDIDIDLDYVHFNVSIIIDIQYWYGHNALKAKL